MKKVEGEVEGGGWIMKGIAASNIVVCCSYDGGYK